MLLTPASASAAAEVLERVPLSRRQEAAAHLLSPVHALVGMQVRRDGDRWLFREQSCEGRVSDLLRMFQFAQQPGDVYLDLREQDMCSLVKQVRSGSGLVVGGLSELWGLPGLYLGGSVPATQHTPLVRAALRGQLEQEALAVGLRVRRMGGNWCVH